MKLTGKTRKRPLKFNMTFLRASYYSVGGFLFGTGVIGTGFTEPLSDQKIYNDSTVGGFILFSTLNGLFKIMATLGGGMLVGPTAYRLSGKFFQRIKN